MRQNGIKAFEILKAPESSDSLQDTKVPDVSGRRQDTGMRKFIRRHLGTGRHQDSVRYHWNDSL